MGKFEDLCVCVCVLFFNRLLIYLLHFYSFYCIFLLHALNLAFAKIPIGRHTVFASLMACIMGTCSSILIRLMYGSIMPFETLIMVCIAIPSHDILFYRMDIVPAKNKHTHTKTNWSLDNWVHLPSSHRFDLQVKRATRKVLITTYVCVSVSFLSQKLIIPLSDTQLGTSQ